eukprot:CAMPEP_0117614436 /NCGR_PEP_ID=MMETSP0784-20121206/84038_1 /TAXON_ID=39447 /ORGANISM="" /LENGTH=447 /DNA_ID=CAMNT_0005418171 /DNA_START=171 /DNA_END=1512 /DNA_ORIENTATION=-
MPTKSLQALRGGRRWAAKERGAHPVARDGPAASGGIHFDEVDRAPDGKSRKSHDPDVVALAVQRPPPQVVRDGRAPELDETVGEELCGRFAIAYVRHCSLVAICETLRRVVADRIFIPSAEHAAQVLALLRRYLGGRRLPAHRAIADGKDLAQPGAFHAQALVHEEPAAIGLPRVGPDLLTELPRERPHADARDPDERPEIDCLHSPVLELDLNVVLVRFFHHRVQTHVDALAHQVLLDVLAHGFLEHRKQARERLHECDLEMFAKLRELSDQILFDEVGQFAAELDSCWPAAYDHHVQQLLHTVQLSSGKRHVGLLHAVEKLLPDLSAMLDLLQEHSMLVDAGNAEGVGLRANGDDKVVVVQSHITARTRAEYLLRLEIHVATNHMEVAASRDGVPNRLDDRAWRNRARGAAAKQGSVEEERPGRDNCHVVQFWVQLLHERERTPT